MQDLTGWSLIGCIGMLTKLHVLARWSLSNSFPSYFGEGIGPVEMLSWHD